MTIFQYEFMQNAVYVSFFIGILCPCIGIFLVLRRYSMIGDTLSHSSLAGVALSLLANFNPIIGAFVFTAICGALIEFLRTYFQKFSDLIMTIILAFSVGMAITIVSSGKLHMNIESFMFGSILTVTHFDIVTIIVLSFLSVLTLIVLYSQLIYIAYDEEAAKVAGVRVKLINYIFAILVATAISVSIRIVGVLVLSSMIALPVATALQLGKGFYVTLIFSIIFSITNIMSGLFVSYFLNVAPGGCTALVSVFVLICVLLFKKVLNFKRG